MMVPMAKLGLISLLRVNDFGMNAREAWKVGCVGGFEHTFFCVG